MDDSINDNFKFNINTYDPFEEIKDMFKLMTKGELNKIKKLSIKYINKINKINNIEKEWDTVGNLGNRLILINNKLKLMFIPEFNINFKKCQYWGDVLNEFHFIKNFDDDIIKFDDLYNDLINDLDKYIKLIITLIRDIKGNQRDFKINRLIKLNERLILISEFNTFEEFKRELKKIFNIYNIKDMIKFINEKLNDIDIFGMKKEIINYIHNVNKLFVEVRDALNMDINDILKDEIERILNGVKFLLFEDPTDLREEDKQKLIILNNILLNDNLTIYDADILNNEEYIINYFFEGLRRLRKIRDYFNQLKPTEEEKRKILKSLGFFVDLDYVEIWRLDEILNDIKERLNKLKINRFLY